jgi:hypothetical protein
VGNWVRCQVESNAIISIVGTTTVHLGNLIISTHRNEKKKHVVAVCASEPGIIFHLSHCIVAGSLSSGVMVERGAVGLIDFCDIMKNDYTLEFPSSIVTTT